MNKYSCPLCGWKAPNNGFYEIRNKRAVTVKLDVPEEEFYPKIINVRSEMCDGMFEGSNWTEVHKCPKCSEEFEFENANF